MSITRTKRLSLDIPSHLKEEIQAEANRRSESMTTTIARTWILYQWARNGELYRHIPDLGYIKLEIL